MAAQTFEYFFDLPPELRCQILSHICFFPNGILVGGGANGRSVALPTPALFAAQATATSGTNGPSLERGRGNEDDDDDDDDDDSDEFADPPVSLFLASPVLYREAGEIYYGRNVFRLDFTSLSWGRRRQQGRMSGSYSSSSAFLPAALAGGRSGGTGTGAWTGGMGAIGTLMKLLTHPATANARRRIRCAEVYVKRFGALVLDLLVPALEGMVLNGTLKRVRVDVLEAGRGGRGPMTPREVTRLRNVDYAGNPALRALLVLLTDPDMERAELRVPRGMHARFWCGFHGTELSDGRSGSACVRSGPWDVQGGEYGGGFLEVDIHKLVEACAGDAAEFKIKKVGFDRYHS